MHTQIEQLQTVVSHLGSYDQKFALDLIRSYKKYGKLTPKQEPWVEKLIQKATTPKPEPQAVKLGEFSAVVALFKKAKEHLKFPKIVLQCDGKKIVLGMAGKTSKHPGSINVVGEGSFPDRPWYGFISEDGTWAPSVKMESNPEFKTALTDLLTKFGQAPARVAKEHGKLTGNCCFCNSALTDPRSTAAGFGPVCADHYGLTTEWKTAVEKMEKKEAQDFIKMEMKGAFDSLKKAVDEQLIPMHYEDVIQKDYITEEPFGDEKVDDTIPPTPEALHGFAVEAPALEGNGWLGKCTLCEAKTTLMLDGHFVCFDCAEELGEEF